MRRRRGTLLSAAILVVITIVYLLQRSLTNHRLWYIHRFKLDAISPVYAEPPLENNEFVNKTKMTVAIDFNKERLFTIGHPLRRLSRIPKINHLIWTNETIPTVFVDYVKSFRSSNPGWKLCFWTYSRGRQFIEEHYPNLIAVFDGYKAAVSKADALRYIVMYHYGGAYFDIDTKLMRSLDTVADKNECIVSPEPKINAVFLVNIRSLLSSAGFMCTPRHAFFKYLMDRLPRFANETSIMKIAGPLFVTNSFDSFITHCINKFEEWNDSIRIVSYKLFEYRLTAEAYLALVKRCQAYNELIGKINDCVKVGGGGKEVKKNCTILVLQGQRMYDLWACKEMLRMDAIKMYKSNDKEALGYHMHFGTYTGQGKSQLTIVAENHIRNIVPSVYMYPYLPDFV